MREIQIGGGVMIILDLPVPENTLECPFLQEDPDDNTLWCYFHPAVMDQCPGLYKGFCPIVDKEEN